MICVVEESEHMSKTTITDRPDRCPSCEQATIRSINETSTYTSYSCGSAFMGTEPVVISTLCGARALKLRKMKRERE